MPVDFWAGALIVLATSAAVIAALYAFALWASARSESYFTTLWNLVKQICSGDFW